MRRLLGDFLRLCGPKSSKIKQSVAFGFFDGLFQAMPFVAVFSLFFRLEEEGWSAGELAVSDALLIGLVFAVGVAGRWVMKFLAFRFQSFASYEAVADARIEIGDRIKRAPMGFFGSKGAESTVTTLVDDLHFIEQNAANILEKTVNGCINVFVMSVGITVFEWKAGIVFLAGTALSLAVISAVQKKGLAAAVESKKRQNAANERLVEYLHGLSVSKLFPGSRSIGVDIEGVFGRLRDASYAMERTFIKGDLAFSLVSRVSSGAIMAVVALLACLGEIGAAKAAVLLVAVFSLFQPLENLANMSAMARMMEVSLKRVEEIRSLPTMDGGCAPLPDRFSISFKDVTFSYDATLGDVVRDVSFVVPEKKMTAIVGPSGCGKTTLTRLMARFWDVDSGSVSIGGVDVRSVQPEDLYSLFSIVFQDVFLFNDTIENNIKLGKPDATHKEVVAAARKACCHEFVSSLERGYETVLAENGGNLSGGERQRISFARAILKDAPIVLLDEATSSVDPENEWLMGQAVQELTRDKTVIVIAHKVKTIMDADQIIVLDAGRVHGIGTHDELLASDEIYGAFWNTRKAASEWRI